VFVSVLCWDERVQLLSLAGQLLALFLLAGDVQLMTIPPGQVLKEAVLLILPLQHELLVVVLWPQHEKANLRDGVLIPQLVNPHEIQQVEGRKGEWLRPLEWPPVRKRLLELS
jgi:hypothetical protein